MAILWGISILVIAWYAGARLIGGRRLFSSYDAPIVALGIGLGACAHVVYLLGQAKLYYEWLFRALMLLGAILVVLLTIRGRKVDVKQWLRATLRKFPRAASWAFWCMAGIIGIVLFALGVLFVITATPTMLTDTYMYHVTVPKAYLGHRGIFAIPQAGDNSRSHTKSAGRQARRLSRTASRAIARTQENATLRTTAFSKTTA